MTTAVSQQAKITSEFNTALVRGEVKAAAIIYKEWAWNSKYKQEFNRALDQLDMTRIVIDAMYDLGCDYVDQP